MHVPNAKETVLVISDLQMPFHHEDALKFLAAVNKKFKPTRIVNIGDITDSYCLSNWVRDPDAISASEEIAEMQKGVKALAKMFPKMDVMTSNHDLRLQRAAKAAGIPKHFLKEYHDWMGCPKSWVFSDEVEIDGVTYMHGDQRGAGGVNAAIKRVHLTGRSVVAGHLHTQAGITYHATKDKLLFGMQVGSLIDRKALAFAYAKSDLKKPILSIGLVIKGVPHIIPMLLNTSGRWVGKL